jgi:hypothetical protein
MTGKPMRKLVRVREKIVSSSVSYRNIAKILNMPRIQKFDTPTDAEAGAMLPISKTKNRSLTHQ